MKEVKMTMEFVIDVDDNIVDIEELCDRVVVCFRNEDKLGIETFLPQDDGLMVIGYISTTIDNITELE